MRVRSGSVPVHKSVQVRLVMMKRQHKKIDSFLDAILIVLGRVLVKPYRPSDSRGGENEAALSMSVYTENSVWHPYQPNLPNLRPSSIDHALGRRVKLICLCMCPRIVRRMHRRQSRRAPIPARSLPEMAAQPSWLLLRSGVMLVMRGGTLIQRVGDL
jgi:hypothetical protein